MALRHDILLDEDGNYKVENGDFAVGESDDQHVEKLITTTKGGIRQYPTVGAGIINYVKKLYTDLTEFKREVNVNLKLDGYKMKQMQIDENGGFDLDYERDY